MAEAFEETWAGDEARDAALEDGYMGGGSGTAQRQEQVEAAAAAETQQAEAAARVEQERQAAFEQEQAEFANQQLAGFAREQAQHGLVDRAWEAYMGGEEPHAIADALMEVDPSSAARFAERWRDDENPPGPAEWGRRAAVMLQMKAEQAQREAAARQQQEEAEARADYAEAIETGFRDWFASNPWAETHRDNLMEAARVQAGATLRGQPLDPAAVPGLMNAAVKHVKASRHAAETNAVFAAFDRDEYIQAGYMRGDGPQESWEEFSARKNREREAQLFRDSVRAQNQERPPLTPDTLWASEDERKRILDAGWNIGRSEPEGA